MMTALIIIGGFGTLFFGAYFLGALVNIATFTRAGDVEESKSWSREAAFHLVLLVASLALLIATLVARWLG